MRLGRLASTVLLIAVGLALPTCADAESPARGILIIDEFNQDSHFAQQFRQTIHSTLGAETTAHYTLYSESLDISRFSQVDRATVVKVARILNGEIASNIPLTVEDANKPVFDARQLKRRGVDLTILPANSDIRFRQLSAWELYRWQIVSAFVVVAIQGLALLWFFHERRRRQAAEQESHQHLLEVTRLDRAMMASAMSTSIAHELSQPLTAILNNAEGAEMLLSAGSLTHKQLKEILGEIRRDNQRAVAIIKHLRMLLKQSELQAQDVDLAETVRDALKIIEPRAGELSVTIQIDTASAHFCVRADPIHLQQVILNLGMNAIDAMQNVRPDGRILMLRIRQQDEDAVVSMEDTGPGIPQDKLNAIFKAFVTTKSQGTGLGLSIARTIIETYGGRIWAENKEQGGAAFHFALKIVYTGAPIAA